MRLEKVPFIFNIKKNIDNICQSIKRVQYLLPDFFGSLNTSANF